ncbi:MAG: PEGA domain-containing protein, partial [Myxococcales bacterium]|nr:PEGA domain-containing protein [Myxococcales bacterium]
MRPPFCSAVMLSLCLSLAGVQVQAAPAPGGDEPRLAVLPLRVEGTIDGETRERWTAGLRDGLLRGQAQLVDPAQVTPYLEGNCDRQSCYDRVRANSGATHILRTTVVAKNRDFILKLDLIDAKTGEVVLSEGETCEICGSTELVTLLDSQGALLQTRLAAMGSGPAVLVLDTRPSGALVFIDGEVVGTTPLERPVLEGSHKIRVSLNGYVAEERELTLVNGAREEVELSLQRTPGNPKSRALGAAGLAGGLVMLGAGIALVALDDAPYKKTCVGDGIDAQGDCKS